MGITLVPFEEQIAGKGVRVALWILLGAGVSVLLIGCANAATLLLARGLVRQTELAIRAALGASPRRISAQLLVESLLLSVLAGTFGTLLAAVGLRALIAFAPAGTPRLEMAAIDLRVLAFACAASFLCSLTGLLPAWQIARFDPREILQGGSRGGTLRQPPRRAHNILIVAEVAMSVVLLWGAGLMLASVMRLNHVPLGLSADRALAFRVALPADKVGAGIYPALLQRLKSVPGVEQAGVIDNLSLTYARPLTIHLENAAAASTTSVFRSTASPELFSAIGATLRGGRIFAARDEAIVNETLAAQCWPAKDAIGKRITLGQQSLTIVGIVADMRRDGAERPPRAEMFTTMSQQSPRSADFVVRTQNDPLALLPAIQREVAAIDRNIPIFRVSTLSARLAATSIPRRFQTGLITLFAGAALFLAAVGIYGVLHYSVAQRTSEIGIRVALGATPAAVLRMVIRQGLSLAYIGLGIGVALVILLQELFANLPLFGVTPIDPATSVAVVLLITVVAVVASLIPAWRAASADPVHSIRSLA
jgi:predicted permease